MKRILFTLLIFVFAQNAFGQGINFQGVARSANGTILASQKISLKLSIITGSSTSTPDYIETRSVATNTQGIFSVVVGDTGTISTIGTYASISWKTSSKFLKVEMDPNNGISFISMGTTPLQYVPFSYYSNGVDAANVAGVLPIKSGGTGVTSLSDLKAAINTTQSSTFLNRINFTDENANDHIAKYDTGYNSPLIYSRYFYGHYGDLILQGMSKTYTGNIHFVTGSNIAGYDPPTQRMVIMDNGNVGIGDFVSSAPTSKLQVSGIVSATGYKVPGGLSTQYLRADGTVATSQAIGVPYTGASQATDLGAFDMKVNGITVGLGSGQNNTNVLVGSVSLISNTTGARITSMGSQTLRYNSTGMDNTGIGFASLSLNTTGNYNTAIGSYPLELNISGSNNTALGYGSNRHNTSGNYNTSYGFGSLSLNQANSGSTAIGQNAMYFADNRSSGITTGNTAVGYESLRGSTTAANNTGINNTAVGYNTMVQNTSGYGNSAFGKGSLATNTSGAYNAAIGQSALEKNTTGNYNIGVGYQALVKSTTSDYNVAIGSSSLFENETGANNVAVGSNALGLTISGSNTAFGTNAGATNSTGINNVYIGKDADAASNNLSNSIAIGASSSVTTSNTIQLGNTSITDVKTSGNLTAAGYKIPGGLSTQYLRADGTVTTSVTPGVPYTGASQATNLGAYDLTVNGLTIGVGLGAISTNTVIGNGSLSSNTTGYGNSVIGWHSLLYNTTGFLNSTLGQESLLNNTTGSRNIALGYQALATNVTKSGSIAIGYYAMSNADNSISGASTGNIAIGEESLRGSSTLANNTGTDNNAIGSNTLKNNTSGSSNVAIGTNSLYSNTSGSNNASIGYNSLNANTTGSVNVALGNEALRSNIIGSSNVAIGHQAMLNFNTAGSNYNNAIGEGALKNLISGGSNSALGVYSLSGLTTGSSNNAIGRDAGSVITVGSQNIFIGNNSDASSNSLSNAIAIGTLAIVSASNTIQLGNSSITNVNTSGTFKSNGIISNIVTKTSAYTALTSDEIITGDATSGIFTITLPTAVGVTGQTYTIKRINSGGNAVTVGTTSSQTIDGITTYALSAQYKYVKVASDGANWIIIGNN